MSASPAARCSMPRASGRLVLHADGSIDATASDARRAQATDPSMQRGRHNPSLRPVPEAAVGAVADTLREQGLPAPQAAGGMTYLQARTANVRIPTIATTCSDRSRPAIPGDRDQCGAGGGGAVGR